MLATMPMTTTTTSNSINEKPSSLPFFFIFSASLSGRLGKVTNFDTQILTRYGIFSRSCTRLSLVLHTFTGILVCLTIPSRLDIASFMPRRLSTFTPNIFIFAMPIVFCEIFIKLNIFITSGKVRIFITGATI